MSADADVGSVSFGVIMTKKIVAGYVLLEVLVALLIFSLGLLGMIGFQASATKIASDSRFRTEAAMLADELIGRMSMSKIGGTSAVNNGVVTVVGGVRDQYCSGSGSGKLKDWINERVKGGARLPGADVTVACDAGNITSAALVVKVTIRWDVPGSSGKVGDPLHGTYETKAMIF